MKDRTEKVKRECDILSMGIGDYGEVYRLWEECEGVGLSSADGRDGIARYLERNPGMSFIAKDEGRIVGALLAGHDGRRGYIYHLAVQADNRRRRIGQMLVEESVKKLLEVGIQKIHLFAYSDNMDGRAFWEANGFRWRGNIGVMTRDLV
jgi:N-acetylglutamate synthase